MLVLRAHRVYWLVHPGLLVLLCLWVAMAQARGKGARCQPLLALWRPTPFTVSCVCSTDHTSQVVFSVSEAKSVGESTTDSGAIAVAGFRGHLPRSLGVGVGLRFFFMWWGARVPVVGRANHSCLFVGPVSVSQSIP